MITETTGLSKQDMLKLLNKGKKVSHRYFSSNEWMKLDNNGVGFEFEDGYIVSPTAFWRDRSSEQWESGWIIVQ